MKASTDPIDPVPVEVCLNGHARVEHMNERGVCTKCAARYNAASRLRSRSRIHNPSRENRNVDDKHY